MKKGIFFWLIVIISTTLLLISIANAKGNGNLANDKSITNQTVFIHHINVSKGITSITADDIQWYEGEEANKQFRLHESESGLEAAPDGYYIWNDSSNLQVFKISAGVHILMQIYNRPSAKGEPELIPNEPISLQQFIALFEQKDGLDMRGYPFHLTIQHGEVVKIVQQFIP